MILQRNRFGVTLYSHSRLSSFENCPKQFEFRYVLKVKTDTEGIEAYLGKRVHEILERLYHHVARHGQPPSLAQVRERFLKDWKLHWHGDIEIVRKENSPEFYIEQGNRCLENYYRGHYPFEEGETVALEHRVKLKLDEHGRYLAQGIIDRLSRRSEGRYEIHDYKTGASLPPRSRLETDRQLALYQLGIEQTFEDVQEVELVWHYLNFNKTFRVSRSRATLDRLCRETIDLIDVIEASTSYPARPSTLCRWCSYRAICPDATADARTSMRNTPTEGVAGDGVAGAGVAGVGAAGGALTLERAPALASGVQLSLLK